MFFPSQQPATVWDSVRSIFVQRVGSFKVARGTRASDALPGASLECINRGCHLFEAAHKDDPSKPSFERAPIFMAEEERAGASALSAAAELGRETAIEKEKRKAQPKRPTCPRHSQVGRNGATCRKEACA